MLTLHADTQAALDARLPLEIVHMVYLGFAAPMRLNDGKYDFLYGGNNWIAMGGGILEIPPIIEDGSNVANGFSVVFGEPMFTTLLTADYGTRRMEVYLAIVSGGGVVGDPITLAVGDMAPDWIDESVQELSMTLQGESLWLEQFDPVMHSRTNQSQKARFPADDGLANVARMQKVAILWPGPGVHYYR